MAIDHHNLCLGCMEERGASKTCPCCGYEEGAAPISAHHLAPGTLLENKYLLGRVLGQGGFGITYIAWDRKLDMKLAIKEYFPQGMAARIPGRPEVDNSSGELKEQLTFGLQRFINEARTLARFAETPNIVTVRDYFEANGTAYLVMSYVEGVTLEQYLQSKGGRISFKNCLEIMMPVLDALREVHEVGVMHRDISPDNIFINREGRVILIDFGAARQEMREKSKSLSVILKAGYAPEEQYRSRGKQGPWTDIYAVAATMYRCITGQVSPEAMDRLAEDDLVPPSKLGISITRTQEAALIKALSVRAGGRFQTAESFQAALMGSTAIKEETPPEDETEEIIAPPTDPPNAVREKVIKIAAIAVICGLVILGAVSFFGGGGEEILDPTRSAPHEAAQTYDPVEIAALDAEYYIDYENGTMPIGDLPIGTRVVDPSWEWEFRTGNNYSDSGEVKPVTWIIVAKDHYDGLVPHVTLLSEELIAKHAFDNSSNRGYEYDEYGYNHWGESGTVNATRGLRPWLNSSGIHANEGFYRAFSKDLKRAVLTTALPNKDWKNGSAYSTSDTVFVPSTTELGDSAHNYTYRIGTGYPYFEWAGDAKRVARLDGETCYYWTRSPDSLLGCLVRLVSSSGEFYYDGLLAYSDDIAVRPALNLKSGILVSEIRK